MFVGCASQTPPVSDLGTHGAPQSLLRVALGRGTETLAVLGPIRTGRETSGVPRTGDEAYVAEELLCSDLDGRWGPILDPARR